MTFSYITEDEICMIFVFFSRCHRVLAVHMIDRANSVSFAFYNLVYFPFVFIRHVYLSFQEKVVDVLVYYLID
jgi:hypothetical protein